MGLALIHSIVVPDDCGADLSSQAVGGDDYYQAYYYSADGFSHGPVTVVGTDGTVYYFTNTGLTNVTSNVALPFYVEDHNGNQITFGSSCLTGAYCFTDTLNRELGWPAAGTTGDVKVPGLSNDYAVRWETLTGVTWGAGFYPVPGFNNTYHCGSGGTSYNPTVVKSIQLPNGQTYSFQYDIEDGTTTYGLISQITYPTGAVVKYTWAPSSRSDLTTFRDGQGNVGGCKYYYDTPAIHTRTVSVSSGSQPVLSQTFTYTTRWNNPSPFSWNPKITTVTTTDNVVGKSFTTTYQYSSQSLPAQPNEYDLFAAQIPVEQTITYTDWGSSTVLRTLNKTWQDPNLMTQETVTLNDGSNLPTAETDYAYYPPNDPLVDPYPASLLVDEFQYDYGSGSKGAILKHTHFDYDSFGLPRAFPSQLTFYRASDEKVCATASPCSGGNEAAETDYTYDGSALSGTSGVVQHDDTNYPSTYNVRGNLTQKTEVCLGCNSAVTTYTYDDTGQVLTTTDPCGNGACADMAGSNHTTTYTYSHANAYVATITYPSTNGVAHSVSFGYDGSSGQLTSSTDQNGGITNYDYTDPLARLKQATGPAQGNTAFDGQRPSACSPNNPQTSYQYDDIPGELKVIVTKLLCGSASATSTAYLDGLGRPTETVAENGAKTDTTYDGLGQVWTVSNPYLTLSDPTYGLSTYTRDGQGRLKTVTRPDQNTVTTSPSGNCATVTDEAGKKRQSCSDALGRITQVTEDPGGLGYSTTYAYNAISDLTDVFEVSQPRQFGYDSLSRLTSAANPESGTVHYTYDTNGNVQTRVDARNITTTYGYDALNRLTSKSYNDSVTPTANFSYDETSVYVNNTPINIYKTIGRLSHWTTTVGSSIQTEGIYSYNGVGGVQDFWECTPFDCGTVSNNGSMFTTYYEYDLAGDLGLYAVPAGAVYPYVNGAQQVNQVTSTFPGTPSPLAQNITYAAAGALATLQDGCTGSNCTSLQETWTYNTRFQPVMVQVGTSTSPNSVSCDAYYYYSGFSPPAPGNCPTTAPTSGTGNNGNAMGWSHWDGGGGGLGVNNTTSYTYDAVNRLTQATVASRYTQNYNYDAYGNMGCSGNYCGASAGLTFNAATNHITTINQSGAGVSYDLAGNLTGDGTGSGTHTFQWDAENRLISVDNGSTASFVYNALGERVQKAAGGQTTYYYHDASGNIAMNEITSVGQTHVHEYYFPTVAGRNYGKYYWNGTAWETDYLHGNPLGSSQVVTRSDNNYLEAEVFFPFGGLRWRGGGTQDVRFAGMQERDGETSTWQDPLDPTPNRLYTSGLGRWLTPDPAGKEAASLVDPQTWNMYAYVRNNPTTFTDPSGLLLAQPSLVMALQALAHASEANKKDDSEEKREAGEGTPDDQSGATASQSVQGDPPAQEQNTAPPDSRTDVVLYPRELPPTPQPGTSYIWQMDWYTGTCSSGSCTQSAANKNQTITLVESKNGGPWKPTGEPGKGEAHDQISPEPKKFNQHWFVADPGGKPKQVQLVVGKDSKGNFIKTWEVHVEIKKLGDRPVYSPVP